MAAVNVWLEPLARGPQRIWVAINAYEVSIVRRERSKQCGRMAAAAESPVNIRSRRVGDEPFDGFRAEHRDVVIGGTKQRVFCANKLWGWPAMEERAE